MWSKRLPDDVSDEEARRLLREETARKEALCTYIYIYICIYTHTCIYLITIVHIYIYIYTYIHTYIS